MESPLIRAQSLLVQQNPQPNEALILLTSVANGKETPWPVLHYIGIAYLLKREFDQAVIWLQKAVNSVDNNNDDTIEIAVTYHAMSICYLIQGSFDQAEKNEKRAVEKKSFYSGWMHLAAIYREQAKLKDALHCYQKAVELEPENNDITRQIAEIYRNNGRLNKAKELFEFATETDDQKVIANGEIAKILIEKEQFDEAKDHIDQILEEEPESLTAKTLLTKLYRDKGNYKKAIEICEDLLQDDPASIARLNYAVCLQELGRFDESEENYLQMLDYHPEQYLSLSNYLMGIHYNPENSKQKIYDAHMKWDKLFAPDKRPGRPVASVLNKDKKLRIGLVSGGMRIHPVGWMITGALEHLPGDQFEIYCYTTNTRYDQITNRISETADQWRSVVGYSDETVANMIRDDEVDILIELSGHASDNRLRTVVREPAPVIVKWVGGLFNTTGLQSVDYLITDQYESPEGEEEFYTEKLVRMPNDYVSYLSPDYAPDVEPLPAEENGYITFGCFNNPSKINDEILVRWAAIMNQLPKSRLLLKSKQYHTEALRERIITTMKNEGIPEERLILKGHSAHKDHLTHYNQIDIALDPWPYSGGLTTCEALWMGVPVITKPGPTFAGRHSTTHLTNAGFPGWVVDTWEEYVEKTVELAKDLDRLAELRSTMRQQVKTSPLCNNRRFAAHLSAALREMWNQRIDGYEEDEDQWQHHINVEALSEKNIEEHSHAKREPTKKATAEISEAAEGILASMQQELHENSNHEHPGKEKSVATNGKNNFDKEQAQRQINQDLRKNTANLRRPAEGEKEADSLAQRELHSRRNENEKTDIFKIETKDDVTICTPPDLDILTPYVLLEQEQWFEPELDFVRDYIQPGMNILDIGAGFGVYALPIAKLMNNEGQVYAFEPGSVACRHLKMSKTENNLDNLHVIGRAVAHQTGEAKWHVAETPELNKLDTDSSKTVYRTTLDTWWQFEGKRSVDFIKIDVNGDEVDVLAGAKELLSDQSPVIQFAAGEGNMTNIRLIEKKLKKLEYDLYEYTPGLRLLSKYNSKEQPDSYLMNLFAVKRSREIELKKQGKIYDRESLGQHTADFRQPAEEQQGWFSSLISGDIRKSKAKKSPPAGEREIRGMWSKVLRELPWTESVLPQWEQEPNSPENENYLRALDYLCTAINIDPVENRSERSKRAHLVLKAVEMLIKCYNGGQTEISVALTLVRGLNMLGRREQAVEVLKSVMETNRLNDPDEKIELPFLLPLPEQDQSHIQTNVKKWLAVRIVEAWLLLKNVTTYFSGEQELELLKKLEGIGGNTLSIQKKVILANLRHQQEIKPHLTNHVDYNLWFWKNSKNIDKENTNFTTVNEYQPLNNETPSEVIQVEINYEKPENSDPVSIKIPKDEVFRLNNIFNHEEYALPDGFHIKDNGVIVDAGANVGAFALYARCWNEDAAIHCFEPNPQVTHLLESNTSKFNNIYNNFVALGNSDGELTLTQHPANTGESTTSHSIEGGEMLDIEVRHAGRALKESGIKEIDVLKIDTEGAEISILKGLEDFLPHTKIIMLEYHTEEDRREIDKILYNFRLCSAEVQQLWGIGTMKYINNNLLK